MPDPKRDLSRDDYIPQELEIFMGLPLSRKCSICKAGDDTIHMVNSMLIKGETYSSIMRELDKVTKVTGIKFGLTSLRTHQEKHVPYKQKALRKIAEKNALQYNKDIMKGEENFLTAAAFAEAIMQKGFESLAKTEIIDYNDGLRAAMVLDNIKERDSDKSNKDEYMQQLSRIIDAVKESVPIEYHAKIIENMNKEPVYLSSKKEPEPEHEYDFDAPADEDEELDDIDDLEEEIDKDVQD